MNKPKLSILSLLFLFILAASTCRADVALFVEDPAGYKGFFSDSGHLAIWISNACVGTQGLVTPCQGGSGVVLSSTSYWLNRGWAAIPAQLYLEGTPNVPERDAWSEAMGATYPDLPVSYGRKYIGRLNHRGAYVLRIQTTPEQDASVLSRIQQDRSTFRYTTLSSNCSDFARQVLSLYFPKVFARKLLLDFGISTPHGVANRFYKLGRSTPSLQMRVYYISRLTASGRFHDGPTKGICEAAITDAKYAIPLLIYQPIIYAAFGACYLITDEPGFMHRGFRQDVIHVKSFGELNASYEASLPATHLTQPQESPAKSAELVAEPPAPVTPADPAKPTDLTKPAAFVNQSDQ